jgi:hypothetical protein
MRKQISVDVVYSGVAVAISTMTIMGVLRHYFIFVERCKVIANVRWSNHSISLINDWLTMTVVMQSFMNSFH